MSYSLRKSNLIMPYIFRLELEKILTYRVDFWIQFIGSLLSQFAVAWFLWKSIFTVNNIDHIGEYSFKGLMLYYLLVPLIGRAIRGNAREGVAEDIYLGFLSRYLIYPISYFGYRFTIHIAHTFIFMIQSIIVLFIFLLFFNQNHLFNVSTTHIFFAVTSIATATILNFILISLIQLTAFWADNVWSLVVIVRFATGLLGGGMIPLSLFPGWLQTTLYKLPFSYFTNFPIRCLMGKIGFHEWCTGLIVTLAWTALFLGIYSIVWNHGKYKYTGVGI